MRKGRDGEKKTGKIRGGKKDKRLMIIVATTSLPAIDRLNADRWNAARLRQYLNSKLETTILGGSWVGGLFNSAVRLKLG